MSDHFIDTARSTALADVGLDGYLAATVIDGAGVEYLILANRRSIGDLAEVYDPRCTAATHDQLGPLPLEFVRRLAISQRTHRPDQTHRKDAP